MRIIVLIGITEASVVLSKLSSVLSEEDKLVLKQLLLGDDPHRPYYNYICPGDDLWLKQVIDIPNMQCLSEKTTPQLYKLSNWNIPEHIRRHRPRSTENYENDLKRGIGKFVAINMNFPFIIDDLLANVYGCIREIYNDMDDDTMAIVFCNNFFIRSVLRYGLEEEYSQELFDRFTGLEGSTIRGLVCVQEINGDELACSFFEYLNGLGPKGDTWTKMPTGDDIPF